MVNYIYKDLSELFNCSPGIDRVATYLYPTHNCDGIIMLEAL